MYNCVIYGKNFLLNSLSCRVGSQLLKLPSDLSASSNLRCLTDYKTNLVIVLIKVSQKCARWTLHF